MTDIKLELMTNIDMYQFTEKGAREGLSYIANRYAKANNKYTKNFKKSETSKFIMYLDANNLYRCAMSQHLQTGDFKWMTEEIEKINLSKYTDDYNQRGS